MKRIGHKKKSKKNRPPRPINPSGPAGAAEATATPPPPKLDAPELFSIVASGLTDIRRKVDHLTNGAAQHAKTSHALLEAQVGIAAELVGYALRAVAQVAESTKHELAGTPDVLPLQIVAASAGEALVDIRRAGLLVDGASLRAQQARVLSERRTEGAPNEDEQNKGFKIEEVEGINEGNNEEAEGTSEEVED